MIYYCVPAHNEEKTVGVVLWKIRHLMAELPRDYQILVGDDASTDGSAEILEPYRRVLPLVLMRNATRRGYAATLEMLLRRAVRMSRYPKRDVIVVAQADFTDDLDGAATMLRRIESGADIATGGPVLDSVPPGLFERLARGYARRALRRFEWPEDADPLNCLNVLRLMCVKRAIEEADGQRILAWDGPAANAALLRAALPHARRVECVEIERHADRAQRRRRFRALEMIGQVRRFAAGTIPADLPGVDMIEADDVRGDLSVLHSPTGNGADGTSKAAGPRARAQRPRQARSQDGQRQRTKRQGKTAAPKSTGSRSAGAQKSARKSTGGKSASAKARTRQPPSAKAAEKPADADATTTGTSGAAPADTSEAPKRSRNRRGRRRGGRGRGNRKQSPADSQNVSASEDTAPHADDGGTKAESTRATPTDTAAEVPEAGQVVVSEGDAPKTTARRRRGRRGGRNRRGGRRRSGTNDARKESGGEPAAPQAPEGPQAEGNG